MLFSIVSSFSIISMARRRKTTTPKTPNPPSAAATPPCNRSSSAILDFLIFVLIVVASTFLIFSFSSYVYNCLSLILPPFSTVATLFDRHFISNSTSLIYFSASLNIFFVFFLFPIFCGNRLRRCGRKGCRGLRNSPESEFHVQGGEDLLLTGDANVVNELPLEEDNPAYDRHRAELRRRAPPNGRAVLLFRARCGCPVSKLEEWGPQTRPA